MRAADTARCLRGVFSAALRCLLQTLRTKQRNALQCELVPSLLVPWHGPLSSRPPLRCVLALIYIESVWWGSPLAGIPVKVLESRRI